MKVARHGQSKILTPDEVTRLFEVGLIGDRDRALFSNLNDQLKKLVGSSISETLAIYRPVSFS